MISLTEERRGQRQRNGRSAGVKHVQDFATTVTRAGRGSEVSFAVTELLCWQGQPVSMFIHVCMECVALAARHVRPLVL